MIPSLLWIYDREVGEWLPGQIIVARKRRVGGFDRHESKKTYVWFSPLGERNHAPTDMATTMIKPMKTLYL